MQDKHGNEITKSEQEFLIENRNKIDLLVKKTKEFESLINEVRVFSSREMYLLKTDEHIKEKSKELEIILERI